MLYILLLIVLVLIITLIVVKVNKNGKNAIENNSVENSNGNVNIENMNISEVDFNNISLKKEGEVYRITSEVINNTQEEKGGFNVQIVFKASSGESLLTLGDYIPKLKPTEKYNINTVVQFDLNEVTNIEIINIDEEIHEEIKE